MLDVLVAGAGPAGTIAALVLARAGARVVVVDRDTFPRDKLCGDTLNPGAVSLLGSLGLSGGPLRAALPLSGMIVSGPYASVEGRYPEGCRGLALTRRALDVWLLEHAVRAGARFESGLVVRAPLLEDGRAHAVVRGLQLARSGDASHLIRLPATVTIAADGRRSVVARAMGLSRHPSRPRRWAYGTYATGVTHAPDLGEMHIRRGFYLGIAPIGGACNICVVTSQRPAGATPLEVIQRAIASDSAIAARFANAELDPKVRVLGPLAVDTLGCGADGLFLAGDAAGFVDPMTGDGLHLAMRGAVLAAEEALRVLADGRFSVAPERLRRAREHAFGRKLRFNRLLRTPGRLAFGGHSRRRRRPHRPGSGPARRAIRRRRGMTSLLFVAGVIFGAMLAEARIAARHDRGLRARGAIEPSCDPYRVMAILYPLCFVLMITEGIWRVSMAGASSTSGAPSWFASGLLMFVAAKAVKYWAIHVLGDRWSFRVHGAARRAADYHWSISVRCASQLRRRHWRTGRDGYDDGSGGHGTDRHRAVRIRAVEADSLRGNIAGPRPAPARLASVITASDGAVVWSGRS